jgi:hypothetical protein
MKVKADVASSADSSRKLSAESILSGQVSLEAAAAEHGRLPLVRSKLRVPPVRPGGR